MNNNNNNNFKALRTYEIGVARESLRRDTCFIRKHKLINFKGIFARCLMLPLFSEHCTQQPILPEQKLIS